MSKPDFSRAESDRLQTLIGYQVLDTMPEIEYDDVTFLASFICETPIALVSFSDEKRQWYKSKVGIGNGTEAERPGSFCDYAIRTQKVFVVPDTLNDIRFANSSSVTKAPFIRFYAGAPIITPNGDIVGTVCVLDRKSRELSKNQLQSLQALARQVAGQLEVRKANMAIRSQIEQLQLCVRKISKHEETLIQSAKMSSLGEMASGLAHEVNNPLAIIMGYNQIILDLMEKNALEPEKVKELHVRIESAGQRIAKIISNLRSFAKDDGREGFSSTNIEELVSQTLDFCRARFKSHHIQFEVGEIPKDLMVDCQKGQIGRLLINLLSNAYDAVIENEERWIRLDFTGSGDFISLSVTDSGQGIPSHLRHQVMQPFFTTKPPGKGTGLGLSVATGIAQVHGGQLRLDENSPSTKFVFTFPKRKNAHLRKSV